MLIELKGEEAFPKFGGSYFGHVGDGRKRLESVTSH